jgi:hypothetical protein
MKKHFIIKPAMPESENVEHDRERCRLGVLGASSDAGGADSGFDRGDLVLVVPGEQRAQPPDFLAIVRLIIHGGTILRLLDLGLGLSGDLHHGGDIGVPVPGLPRLSPASPFPIGRESPGATPVASIGLRARRVAAPLVRR